MWSRVASSFSYTMVLRPPLMSTSGSIMPVSGVTLPDSFIA
jgi:hypothetical protein